MHPVALQLSTALVEVPGITQRQAGLLRGLGLTNVGKLVAHLPLRHETIEPTTTIDRLIPGRVISAEGEITATRPVRGRKPRFEAVMCDHTGRLDLVWFNGLYMAERVHPGLRVRVQGTARTRGPGLQVANPRMEILHADDAPERGVEGEIRPVYPANEEINSAAISRLIRKVLPRALPLIEDHLPEAFRQERGLPELREAYRMQHEPANQEEVGRSRRRLAYDELLLLQLGVHMKRAHLRGRLRAPALKWNPAIDRHIRDRFPFGLTPGQEEAVAAIAADLSHATPANRLIQGDVGSGKTAVALYAMLMAASSGRQAALMAPTEVLAEQHYASIMGILSGSRVRAALLTGSTPPADRESLLADLASGAIDLVVGTHALLTEGVAFKCLAVAVVDEQHRFGVHQRARLRSQASDESTTPHVLVMTATPIPRTLAITLFGDLDICVVKGLPPGRRPVATRVVSSENRGEAYAEVAARASRGEQAFIVAPAIDDGEAAAPGGRESARGVESTLRELRGTWLNGLRLAGLHARMPGPSRAAVLAEFRAGRLDAIVATTIIEVGVDVPNATMMVVEQADRFGLAQLHQLRGRVGRGQAPGLCVLVADAATPEAIERLGIMTQTTDGFEIAEKDLEMRGPGELLGSKQSGLPPFRVADLMRDRELLGLASRDAAAWIARSPVLGGPAEALLRRRLLKAYGAALGLADVG